jgi:hypothetical protein
MAHALIVFFGNENVTAGGERIYPTIMVLWPTYLMIASAAVTVTLNAFIVYWRIRGTIKDQAREEMYNKVWDYVLHGINGTIWLVTTSSFGATKNMRYFGAVDPNVLFGYVCSTQADTLSQTFPQILKFQAQCQIQVCNFSLIFEMGLINAESELLDECFGCYGGGLCRRGESVFEMRILVSGKSWLLFSTTTVDFIAKKSSYGDFSYFPRTRDDIKASLIRVFIQLCQLFSITIRLNDQEV